MIQKYHAWFVDLLHRPARVFWLSLCLAAIGVVLDGSALRLWSLNRDHRDLTQRIAESRAHVKLLEFRIQQASLPGYIERQARDQFDLVKEGDLVFVFSEEEAPKAVSDGESSKSSHEEAAPIAVSKKDLSPIERFGKTIRRIASSSSR